jgi:uncharacterized protein
MRFQECRHRTALDIAGARGHLGKPENGDGTPTAAQRLGITHELAFLQQLRSNGPVEVIEGPNLSLSQKAAMTVRAMRAGAPWIYQAAFEWGRWQGYADFLKRVERPSGLGAYSYEAVDTKLKRSPAPTHLLQLGLYSTFLSDIQDMHPEQMHVVLGDGQVSSFRLKEFQFYIKRQRDRLMAFVEATAETRAVPVKACGHCDWKSACEDEWEKLDSLWLVAGMTNSQRKKLEAIGVQTIGDLAAHVGPVSRMNQQSLDRLILQAKLQHARRRGGKPTVQLRSAEAGKGLSRLPRPNPGDVFFDMEGDPFVPGGLEYLFGLYFAIAPENRFHAVWAHDRTSERAALREVLVMLTEHFGNYPQAHLYHYNHYEPTALKRLCSFHATGEELLDNMLRQERLVDLYRVVQQGILASEPGYSLKDLEIFYLEKRSGDVATAGDSVEAYEKFRESQDPTILEAIRQYNEVDCRSTAGLRDWLVAAVRPADLPWWQAEEADVRAPGETAPDPFEADRAVLWSSLLENRAGLDEEIRRLVLELCAFHNREDKPSWWQVFECAEKESAELIDHLDCIGGLEAKGDASKVKRSFSREYRFPIQETKMRAGQRVRAKIGRLPGVTIQELDTVEGTATIQFGPKAGTPPDVLDLIPDGPIDNTVLKSAVRKVAEDIAAGNHRYQAVEDILCQRTPRIDGQMDHRPLVDTNASLITELSSVIQRMQSTYLAVQGPPGTGKTFSSSHVIANLIERGARIGVTSNSHKAINNLVKAVADRAQERALEFEMVKKVGAGEADAIDSMVTSVTTNEEAADKHWQLVAGTAWLFARDEFDQALDYIFVDEAGQVALANIVAVGRSARNIVLVGDPLQLSQPVQGVHPNNSGCSALEHVLAGHATIPPEKGVLLPVSHRMHPRICSFISDLIYEGRLSSFSSTDHQRILTPDPAHGIIEAGISFVDVDHDGNSQSAEEEVGKIATIVDRLLGRDYSDANRSIRQLTLDDVLVVAPYNAQVNLLKQSLPSNARVGTIDKFQGQEAPVCIISMTTSSSEDLPRDIAFLFSRNRLNVAISRAKCLAIVVASPRLLDVECRSVDDMRLVNTLCALKIYSNA